MTVNFTREFKPDLGVAIDRTHSLSFGLVGAWDINEGGGSSYRDATEMWGAGAINTAGSNHWGHAAQGTDFNCATAGSLYVDIPYNSLVSTFATVFTFEQVFYLNSLGNYRALACKTNSSAGDPFDLYVDAGGTLNMLLGGNFYTVSGLAAGTWYHLVLCVNNPANAGGNNVTAQLILDGVVVVNVSQGFGLSLTDSGKNIKIGRRDDGVTQMQGRFGYVRLWNRCLSQCEVQELLVNHWALSDLKREFKFAFATGPTPLTETLNESLSFSDGFAFVCNIYESFADSITLSDALTVLSAEVLALVLADTLSFSESMRMAFTMVMGESFTIADALQLGLLIPKTLSDSITFLDAVAARVGVERRASDSINNWADFIRVWAPIVRTFSDKLAFNDELSALIYNKPTFSDTINNFTDTARLVLGTEEHLSDALSFSDSVSVRLSNNLSLNLHESLSFLDSLSLEDVGDQVLTNYFRRYLNDAAVSEDNTPITGSTTITQSNLIAFARRYLNDVESN